MSIGKPMRTFVRSTIVGGIVFLVPLIVLIVVVGKALEPAHRVARPIAALFPEQSIAGMLVADIVAVAGVVLVCFLAGLVARWSFASRLARRAEARLLWSVPGYAFIKTLTSGLGESSGESELRPALIRDAYGRRLAFEIERIADGHTVMFLPNAPDPRSGGVMIVSAAQVEPLPITAAEAMRVLQRLGRGYEAALRDHAAVASREQNATALPR